MPPTPNVDDDDISQRQKIQRTHFVRLKKFIFGLKVYFEVKSRDGTTCPDREHSLTL